MKHHLSRRTVVAGLAAATVASPKRARAQSLTHITIVTSPSDSGGEVYYAQDLGIFKKHGLEAEIISLRGGSAVAAAMSSGKYDIGQGNVVSIAAARMKGIPFVLLAPASLYNAKAPTSVLVVSKDSPVKTAADLSGKPVANLELRDIGTVGLDLWLAAANLPPSTIQVVEIPGAEMGAALSRGTVAAAFMIEPFLSASMNENRILGLPYSAIADRFLIAAYFTTTDWLNTHKDTARKFQAALTETARWANNHHAESAQILEKWTKVHVSPTQTRVTYGETLDPKVIQPLLDAATKDAFLAGPVRAAVLMSP